MKKRIDFDLRVAFDEAWAMRVEQWPHADIDEFRCGFVAAAKAMTRMLASLK